MKKLLKMLGQYLLMVILVPVTLFVLVLILYMYTNLALWVAETLMEPSIELIEAGGADWTTYLSAFGAWTIYTAMVIPILMCFPYRIVGNVNVRIQ